jgi:hypothetical protein
MRLYSSELNHPNQSVEPNVQGILVVDMLVILVTVLVVNNNLHCNSDGSGRTFKSSDCRHPLENALNVALSCMFP